MRAIAIGIGSACLHAMLLLSSAMTPGPLDDDDAPIDRETRDKLIALHVRASEIDLGPTPSAGESAPPLGGTSAFMPHAPASVATGTDVWHAAQPVASLRARILRNDYGALAVIARVLDDHTIDPSGAFADALLDVDRGHVTALRMLDEPMHAPGSPWGLLLGEGRGGCTKGVVHSHVDVGPIGDEPPKTKHDVPTSGAKPLPSANAADVAVPRPPSAASLASGCGVDGLPAAFVDRIVRAHLARFERCGETPFGSTTLRFIVDRTGAVETASALSTPGVHPDVARCVADVARTFGFPAPEQGKATAVCTLEIHEKIVPAPLPKPGGGWWGPIGGC